MFIQALVATYRDGCELVAFCDTNPTRMNFYNRAITATFGFPPVRTYSAKDFDRMIRGAQPDAVIVGTMDCTHHLYIIRAMELDREVITEKRSRSTLRMPRNRAIVDAVSRTDLAKLL
jgi:predicted dehydrogenase